MKTRLVMLLAVLLGVAIGVARPWYEMSGDDDFDRITKTAGGDRALIAPLSFDGGQVAAVIEGDETFLFGEMERGQTGSHTFVLRNNGDQPLTIQFIEKTCKCTISKFDKTPIPPGESTGITLEWTPTNYERQFRQVASVHVSDPNRPVITLAIEGRISQSIRVEPVDAFFNEISTHETRSAQLRLYSYKQDDLQAELLPLENAELSELIEVTITPLPLEELAETPDAKSGVLLDITLKPGLPVGAIEQTIRLTTNLEDLSIVEIPVRGSVASDVGVLASTNLYDVKRSVLTLGTIPSKQGKQVTMHLLAKGPFREQVAPVVAQVQPVELKVEIGEAKAVNDGAVLMFPLTVDIPAGTRSMNHQGRDAGKIVINTGHPATGKLTIYVRFTVQ